MFSSSDSETEKPVSRLGECEVCGIKDAIYTCPKCEVKTCCLNCVRIHKTELDCDGSRDRTKFIRMKNFTDTDLLSDYRLLEECARFVYGVKRNVNKRFTRIDKNLPVHLYKLKNAAMKRGIILQFLAQNFTNHSINTTKYNYKTNIIYWRIEWVFPNAEIDPVKFSDDKCSERSRLSELLDKYVNAEAEPFEGSKALTYYKSAGFTGVRVLLRAEKVRGSAKKFFELDLQETLSENLSGKCIVEFPIIFVVLKDHAYNFDIITPEDEFDYEDQVNNKETKIKDNIGSTAVITSNNSLNINVENGNNTQEGNKIITDRKRHKQLFTEKIAKEKQLKIQREIKEERKKKPKNLLFTTGYSSEESLEHSDSEMEI